jgi:hypothetical protein
MQLNRLATAIVAGVVVVLTTLSTGAAFATTTTPPAAGAHPIADHVNGGSTDGGPGGTDW